MDEFGLIRCRHHHHVRQAAEIGEIERTRMGRAIGPHEARAIHREAHRQVLERDIMHELVVAALQEGGIDRAERLVALRRHAGREGHGVLLGDPDIEGALRKGLPEEIEARARGHGGGDGDDLVVCLGLALQAFGENLGVARRIGRRLRLLASDDVEFLHAVILVGAGLGGA